MKEYLDSAKNYTYVQDTAKRSEDWIEVPGGADTLTKSGVTLYFWNKTQNTTWVDGEGWCFCDNARLCTLDSYLNDSDVSIVWQREKESLNDKVASAEEFRKESINDLPEFKHDFVNHPKHYTSGNIECINAIQASMSKEAFAGFLKGNIIKYMWRYEHKNGVEDLKKSQWYQNKLIELLG